MANINDVAAYVVSKFPPSISTMKLQKLCYIAQGWSLAITDEPLFEDQFEAWKNGPVNFRLFDQHRRDYSVAVWPSGDRTQLTPIQLAVLDGVIKNYGGLSGIQLGDLTHREGTPWSQARLIAGVRDGERTRQVIPTSDIQVHFKELLGV